MSNAAIIEKFYSSFAKGDAEGMVSCYANDVVFQDPAFGVLHGDKAKAMWRMLLKSADVNVTFSNVGADAATGSADWVATYKFSKTGRNVVNKVSARFTFKDGLITQHTDSFDMWAWTKQALGMPGYLLGWSSYLRNKINGQAVARLEAYIAKDR